MKPPFRTIQSRRHASQQRERSDLLLSNKLMLRQIREARPTYGRTDWMQREATYLRMKDQLNQSQHRKLQQRLARTMLSS